jgi:hypothetical protein
MWRREKDGGGVGVQENFFQILGVLRNFLDVKKVFTKLLKVGGGADPPAPRGRHIPASIGLYFIICLFCYNNTFFFADNNPFDLTRPASDYAKNSFKMNIIHLLQ